jgi:hypothetical protein
VKRLKKTRCASGEEEPVYALGGTGTGVDVYEEAAQRAGAATERRDEESERAVRA